MHMFLLVEQDMLPIPGDITIVQNYGHESVVADAARSLRLFGGTGDAMLLEGEVKAFVAWLGKRDGFWKSSNPATGRLDIAHIQQELLDEFKLEEWHDKDD